MRHLRAIGTLRDLRRHRQTVVRLVPSVVGPLQRLQHHRVDPRRHPTGAVVRTLPQARPPFLATLPDLHNHLANQRAPALPSLHAHATRRRAVRRPRRTVRQELAPLHAALISIDRPVTEVAWLSRPAVARLLKEIAAGQRAVTPHEVLDELAAGKTLEHLRAVLVAGGMLPDRDERLVTLERWTSRTVASRGSHEERAMLHRYAGWHHLRRLRASLGTGHTTHLQMANVRSHITAAVNFLDWLSGTGLTLSTCTQPDLEQWKTREDLSYWDQTGHFIRWATKNRLAQGLTFSTERWQGPVGPHDSERRWDDARRLLHDATLTTADRVAGLLLLFYAQRLSTISTLTVDQVSGMNGATSMRLGTAPTVLPEPLAGLVLDLIATRRPYTVIGHTNQTAWLFPGQRPGEHISADRLGQRLIAVGIHPGQARSTALFALAAEVPAAILGRMLGIHIQVAVQWQKASPETGAPTPPTSAAGHRDGSRDRLQVVEQAECVGIWLAVRYGDHKPPSMKSGSRCNRTVELLVLLWTSIDEGEGAWMPRTRYGWRTRPTTGGS
jgi:hypothetical protein